MPEQPPNPLPAAISRVESYLRDYAKCAQYGIVQPPAPADAIRTLLEHRRDTADVAGHCPMGCGETLTRDPHGRILCTRPECPTPDVVAEILTDAETDHIIQLTPDTFTVRHPLRERLDDALMTCEVDQHLANLSGPPAQPGRYRVTGRAPLWTWERLDG